MSRYKQKITGLELQPSGGGLHIVRSPPTVHGESRTPAPVICQPSREEKAAAQFRSMAKQRTNRRSENSNRTPNITCSSPLWDRIKHETTYQVKFDNGRLVGDCVKATQDCPPITKTRVHIRKASERKVIFLGDFIDRGPKIRQVLEIVRPMIEGGKALTVMGNHELNALVLTDRWFLVAERRCGASRCDCRQASARRLRRDDSV